MAAISRSALRSQLKRGIDAVWGMNYAKVPDEWKGIFEEKTTEDPFVEEALMVTLGAAQVRAEGAGVAYDEGREAWTARYNVIEYALGFSLTQQAREDNKYISVADRFGKSLSRSMAHTKNIKTMSVLNNAFDSNYAGGDGVQLCSNAHPVFEGGTQSNVLANPADLDETSLEAMLNLVHTAENDRGIPALFRGDCLVVHINNQWNAHRILESTQRSGTADNDTNALKDMGMLPGGVKPCRYLTDQDAWYVKTDCPDGLKFFQRIKSSSSMSGDFETDNMKYKRRERYAVGYTDWRSTYANPGFSG